MIYFVLIRLLISLQIQYIYVDMIIHHLIILDTVVQPGINFFEDEPEPPAASEEGSDIEDLEKYCFYFQGV